jgi:hypothetical protein
MYLGADHSGVADQDSLSSESLGSSTSGAMAAIMRRFSVMQEMVSSCDK